MSYFNPLEQKLKKYLEPASLEKVRRAYDLAYQAHDGQMRSSGEPYITHPVAAAEILADLHLDHQSIMATLLHDVLEDTSVSKQDLTSHFGEAVSELVDGVSKLTQIQFADHVEKQAENFRKMILAMTRDIRVVLVKLADRLHNMRTLGALPPHKRRRIARETLEIYAPIANRLGIHHFYIELEDLCFKAIYPMRCKVIQRTIDTVAGDKRALLKEVEQNIQESLLQNNIDYEQVFGRQKHLYGIYKKMKQKHLPLAEIMDVYGFRLILKSSDDCYRALGVVHQRYKPITERFKDYIAIPKSNGYQSLHSTLFGPQGVPIEVQIRSRDMDRIAEMGIAAHWIYKSSNSVDTAQVRARQWVQSLLEMQSSSESSIEFIESVKVDLFPEEVYVFTPKGSIREFPRGATAIDFAYAIHSDIGNTCVGVKIDRKLAPLSAPLRNGQTVEVITAKGASPNPAWLNFVITSRARHGIKHYLKKLKKTESLSLGKQLLSQALAQFSMSLEQIDESLLADLSEELKLSTVDALYESIGMGLQVPMVIARRLLGSNYQIELDEATDQQIKAPLQIKGTEGLLVNYASCCKPLPGDAIVGHLRVGEGILVHRDQCANVTYFRGDLKSFVVLSWSEEISGDYEADITLEVKNEQRVLAHIAAAIADSDANIDNINVTPHHHSQLTVVELTVTVTDRTHLAHVLKQLKSLSPVRRVFRGLKPQQEG